MKQLYFFAAAAFLSAATATAQNCGNIHFENADFSNWMGHTGFVPGPSWSPATLGFPPLILNQDPNNTQQFTLHTVNGLDPNCISPVTGAPDSAMTYLAPGGGGVTARLGNSNTGAETERLRFSLNITSFTDTFIYKHALVIENPVGHMPQEMPMFALNFYNSSGAPIAGIGGGVIADSTFTYDQSGLIAYRPWMTDTIDLTGYTGQTITIEFLTSDCTLGGHFGYAYIDVVCADIWNGILENALANTNIYPNPSNGSFNIETFIAGEKDVTIEVMNSLGQVIAKHEHGAMSGELKEEIDISNEPKGIYMIRLTAGKQTITKKIIVE